MLKPTLACLYFLIADSLWINYLATPLYAARLGPLLEMKQGASLIFGLIAAYGLLLGGLLYVILRPTYRIVDGLLMGFIIYGVFAWTNFLILKPWTLDLVLADWAWGTFLYGSSTFIALFKYKGQKG